MTLSVRDEPRKHKLRENGHNRLALWFHPGRSDEGETLGTSIRSTGCLGPGVDYQGVQGTLPGDGKTLYLGCGGGHMTASERCTLEKVSFTTHH